MREAHAAWRLAEGALLKHRAKVEAAGREADYLRASAAELSTLNPQPDEETELAEKRQAMMRAEKTAGDINEAQDVLSGQGSPLPMLSSLFRKLERKKAEAPELIGPVADALGLALDQLSEAQNAVEVAIRAADFDPKVLERTERAAVCPACCLAPNIMFRLINWRISQPRWLRIWPTLEAGADRLAGMEAEAVAARNAFDVLAVKLTQSRRDAAAQVEQAVMAELPALKLERARFIVDLQTDEGSRQASGNDSIEFHVQTNPGTRPGPMMKVASGGELSRFLLALKVALADRGSAPTLVFDEIDTGVGGAVADAIGQRLKKLSQKVQVLSVTHAPQVAARSDTHFLISKAEHAGKMVTGLKIMDRTERLEEIARMLSGAEITPEARAAAERLMVANG